jgi:hypothetical protein
VEEEVRRESTIFPGFAILVASGVWEDAKGGAREEGEVDWGVAVLSREE